ncbi:MAG: ABC transporter substrate-binding protein [Promethearchaeota archaeon]
MRKTSKGLVFIILFISLSISFVLPKGVENETYDDQLLDYFAKDSAGSVNFTVGTAGPRAITNWDMPSYIVSTGDYYRDNALESLFQFPFNSTGDLDELWPVLATSWSWEERPDEMTTAGFMAYDGISSMEVTLREGVTFHDGSNWNATVCKWNIDRLMCILGDINDCLPSVDVPSEVTQNRGIYWMKESDWAKYATASWNASDPSLYFQYGPYSIAYYPGFGVSGDRTDYFPRFTNVTITEDKESGGKVRIYFNDWASGPYYLLNLRFISMEAYKDYFYIPIEGYGTHPDFPQDDPVTFPGHLIGTGPYIFEEHDVAASAGTMVRYDNWWNTTAQQAEGWHTLERVGLFTFSHTETGYMARNLATVTGDLDFAYDRSWEPLDFDIMNASPSVIYHEMGFENYGENVILNCVNETYLRYWDEIDLNVSSASSPYEGYSVFAPAMLEPDDTIIAHGINRAFRKALSYAFDYDTYIQVIFNNRVVRSGGILSKNHENYNPNIPLPYRNLTIARQALIDDPFWGSRVAARNLDITNTTEEWYNIANDNPIYVMEYNYDAAHLGIRNLMETALEDIGCGIHLTEDIPSTYDAMNNGLYYYPWLTTDGFALKLYNRKINNLDYFQAYYGSPGVVERDPLGGSYGEVISDWMYGTYLTPYSQFPYVGFDNMGFNFNATCDYILGQLLFANVTHKQELYDELCDWSQNFQYQNIWLGNNKIGYAINKEYDYTWQWETFRYNLVKESSSPLPNQLPAVSFIVNRTDILVNEWVQFTIIGTLGDPPATFLWDFGDGYTSTNQNATHQYTVVGTYTVSLNVTDANGDSDFDTRINYITVEEAQLDDDSGNGISGYETYLIIGIISITSVVIIWKRLKFKD